MDTADPSEFEIPENAKLPDALAVARRCHRAGRTAQAIEIYEQILDLAPDYPDAINYYAILRFQLGDRKEAIDLLEHCVKVAEDYADAHANLGMMQRMLGNLGRSEAHIVRALELSPGAANFRLALANLRLEQARTDEAETMLRDLVRENPDDLLAHHALNELLLSLGRIEEAKHHYRETVRINPSLSKVREMVSYQIASRGHVDLARHQVRRLLELDPGNVTAQHQLAAVGGAPVPERTSDAAVAEVFDNFAPKFEERLAQLEYMAPEYVGDAIRRRADDIPSPVTLLDAGCGTGLLAPRVRPLARRLVGVDLSEGMLARAEALGLYDELVHAELTAYLQHTSDRFGAIASTDTLCYFGALETVLLAAHRALVPGGWLFFTVEKLQSEREDSTYHLELHGRYSHAPAYVHALLERAGFSDISLDTRTLRKEMGNPVLGLVVAARRAAE
jgi:predicted TPR repeat methyltransferase